MTNKATRTAQLAAAALLASLAFVPTPAAADTEIAGNRCLADIVVIHALETSLETSVKVLRVGDSVEGPRAIEFRAFAFRCGGGGNPPPPPPNPDRDGDGYTNNQEVAQGTDPDDASSFPDNKWTDAECDAWEAEHSGNGPEECRGR